jgi:hypothetical protein
MAKFAERQLDKIIELAFETQPAFSEWFLSRTKFSSRNAQRCFSRSNNPWCRMTIKITDPVTGEVREETLESETDVLVVFQDTSAGSKFALHIENKLVNGKFTHLQPDLYHPRAQRWIADECYGGYSEFATVLIAPQVFYERNIGECVKFDHFVSHEDIARHLPEFGDSV